MFRSLRGSVHADNERVWFPTRLDRTDPRSIRCTLTVIIDYRVRCLSVGESRWPTVGCLFFSARTDLDFRRTPRILLASHVASDVPRGPPAPRLASRPANLRPTWSLSAAALVSSIHGLDIDYGSTIDFLQHRGPPPVWKTLSVAARYRLRTTWIREGSPTIGVLG